MPGSDHALLSPSSAHMWMACPPSAKFSAQFEDKGSDYAQEGTDAHTLCQYKLERALGRDVVDPRGKLSFYDGEMEACSEDYAAFVMETLFQAKTACPDPLVFIEQKLDLQRYIEEGFGYGDCLIIADGLLHVIDFKYGLGVLVSADNNPQMLCYALGALALVEALYDIDTVRMTIFQPRRENVSTTEISREDLMGWANDKLSPAARRAYAGEGEFTAGSHCQFCKAKAVCRARADYNLELARYDFTEPAALDDIEIAAVLTRVDGLVSWASDVKDYALKQALMGKHYDGFKVVSGRSSRKYTDEIAVAKVVEDAGFDPFEKKLLGITAMTAALGKKRFEEVLGTLVYKAPGKPALVEESDKRPALNMTSDDFTEQIMEEKEHDN